MIKRVDVEFYYIFFGLSGLKGTLASLLLDL